MLDSNIMKEKKTPFMIVTHFESILVHDDNGKQNLDGSYIKKY